MNPYEVRKEKAVSLIYVFHDKLDVPKDLVKLVFSHVPVDFKPCLDHDQSHIQLRNEGDDYFSWYIRYSHLKVCRTCYGPVDDGKCVWFNHNQLIKLYGRVRLPVALASISPRIAERLNLY